MARTKDEAGGTATELQGNHKIRAVRNPPIYTIYRKEGLPCGRGAASAGSSTAGGYALRKRLLLAVTLIVNLLVVNLYSVKVYADEVDVIHVGGSLTADELLMKMERNTRALTYQGTLVYAQGRHMETLKLFHKLKDGKQFERLVHLTGMPREILRRGDKVICVHPKNGVVELNNTVPDDTASYWRTYYY